MRNSMWLHKLFRGSWSEGSAPDTEGRLNAAPWVKATKKAIETAVGWEHVKRIRKKTQACTPWTCEALCELFL